VTNLPSDQPGVSEKFCNDQKVPFHQVRLYYLLPWSNHF
jgi:hypothetical protein